MKTIGVIRNPGLEKTESTAHDVSGYLRKKGCSCHIADDGADLPPDCSCALVLGGDGTLLRASKKVLDRQLPLLGVNLGNLGYMAEIDINNLYPALDRLIADEYTVEKRMMLTGDVFRGGRKILTDTALNDVVLHRIRPLRELRYLISVNGEPLNSYAADGVILSTATGSTGYNLSAGGPIVSPSAELILMTPIAPHTLISRSIIFSGGDSIRVEIGLGNTGAGQEVTNVLFDGAAAVPLRTGDSVEVRTAEQYTRIIKINHISFLDVLRRKMADT